jgi:PAT family beta-lactamase induction signal transducer AmpG
MLLCVLCGFSSGMPLYVLSQLVPAWLRESGIDLATIGLMSLVAFPYTWKFVWSPAMDRLVPPVLGRRRGWALITQVLLFGAIASFGAFDPSHDMGAIAVVVGAIALFSASQDIVLDAYRRELLPDHELGIGNAMFVNAYRVSSLVPGSLALILADRMPWSVVHPIVAAFMAVGLVTSLLMPEPADVGMAPKSLREAVVQPFRAFLGTHGSRGTVLILVFMLLYKLGDSMATALLTPFYLDTGFTMTQIGTVVKAASLWSAIAGGVVGGVAMVKLGINRALWLFGVVQLLSILGFAVLAEVGADPTLLFFVVSFEYLGVGLGTAAFVAFIARSTDKRYTATQLALLTSLTGIPRTFANASTGYLIESVGYTVFFLACAVVAVPGMLMLPWVAPWNEAESDGEGLG